MSTRSRHGLEGVSKKTILVLPGKSNIYDIKQIKNKKYCGICSDKIKKYDGNIVHSLTKY